MSVLALIIAILSNEYIQNTLGIIAILSIGIVHGANDLKIISTFTNNNKSLNRIKYFSFYLLTVLLGGLFFFFLPSFALLFFILVSCFHFGEQHWESKIKANKYNYLLYFIYGGVIFLLIALSITAHALSKLIEKLLFNSKPGDNLEKIPHPLL